MARTDYGAILSTVIKDTSDAIREVNGTSALIAPNAWGANIRTMKSADDYENVLDQLIQEEVASAPVASFSDGANDIPLKELSLSINPTQSGSGDPYPAGGGKNKYPNTCQQPSGTPFGVTFTFDDGVFSFNGTATSGGWMNVANFYLGAGTWTASIDVISGSYTGNVLFGATGGPFYAYKKLNTYPRTVTAEEGGTGTFSFKIPVGEVFTNFKFRIQIESGDTATSYAPYSNIRPITGVSSVNVVNTPIPVAPLWTIDSSFNGHINFNQMNKNNRGAQSTKGVTMTTNSDGTATIYGTNDGTGTSWLYFMDADNSHPFVENHVYLL